MEFLLSQFQILKITFRLQRMIIDEADIDLVGGSSPQRSVSRRTGTPDIALRAPLKRKPGPIPRHITLKKRCLSPASSPGYSPPASPGLVNGDLGKVWLVGCLESKAGEPTIWQQNTGSQLLILGSRINVSSVYRKRSGSQKFDLWERKCSTKGISLSTQTYFPTYNFLI